METVAPFKEIIDEINEAGGVLGNDVVQIDSDSGDTSSNIAQQSVDTLLSQNVDAIIGAEEERAVHIGQFLWV